jgi:hypothetical protein
MTVVMDPTKPYTSDGLGPWSRAAKEGDLDDWSQSRWGRRFRIRLTVCLGLRTTSDGDVDGGGHSIVFLAPSSISATGQQRSARGVVVCLVFMGQGHHEAQNRVNMGLIVYGP